MSPIVVVSERQRRVLAMMLTGLAQRDISEALQIGARCVHETVKRIRERNGLFTARQLLEEASARGVRFDPYAAKGGGTLGNSNASKRPADSTLRRYRQQLEEGSITREELADKLGVSETTTFTWIPKLGVACRRPAVASPDRAPRRIRGETEMEKRARLRAELEVVRQEG